MPERERACEDRIVHLGHDGMKRRAYDASSLTEAKAGDGEISSVTARGDGAGERWNGSGVAMAAEPVAALWVKLMHALPLGAVICDAAGKVITVNAQAVVHLREEEGLRLVGDRLRSSHRGDAGVFTAARERARDWALAGAAGDGLQRILLRSQRRDRLVQVAVVAAPGAVLPAETPTSEPLGREESREEIEKPLLLVLMRQLDPRVSVGSASISRLYGFTPAEAKVLAALCRGESILEYAAANELSTHTVRNQVKAAMSKSGAKRQAELVRLVLSSLLGSDL